MSATFHERLHRKSGLVEAIWQSLALGVTGEDSIAYFSRMHEGEEASFCPLWAWSQVG